MNPTPTTNRLPRLSALAPRLLSFAFLVTFASQGWGQISISAGSSASENFNALGANTTAALPANWKAAKSTSAIATPTAYASANSAVEQAGGNSMSTNAPNGIYRFNSNNSTSESAIGGLSSGTASKSVFVYAYYQNNGASSIPALTISYDVEKYRNGSNSAGYTVQLFYSTDGSTWTSCGASFATNFTADADINGYTTAPGSTTSVTSQTYTPASAIATSGSFYLAWRYSVTSGSTTSNAPALGIDNVVVSVGTVATPTITITGNATAAAFTTTYGTASANQSFSVGGSGLTTNLTATAPTGFEVSSDGTTYAGTANFTQSGGSASGTLRVRLAASATVSGTYNAQNIVLSSTNATSVNIATASSGNTVSKATPSLSITSATSAVANGTVSLTSTSPAASVAVLASTGAITYTSSNTSVATISGTTLTAVAAGTTTITASQVSDSNYNAANATQTFTVTSATSPAITPSTSTLTGFTTTSPSASAAQSLTVNAINLSPASGNLTVTGSTNYEVSTTSASTGFGNTATLSYSGSAIFSATANVWIRLKASLAAGNYNSEIIAISGGGATTQNITVSGTVIAATPVVSTNGTLTAFSTVSGNASAAQTLSVTGTNLTAAITATAPTGFEVSTNGTSFASNATISQTSGSASATLSVRIASTASVGALTGNISIASTGATSVSVAVSGNVTAPVAAAPTVVINKYINATPDQVELLVIGNGTAGSTLDMRGMIIKDTSSSMANDTGGKYQFSTASVWSAVPAGTLVVITANSSTTPVVDSANYTISAGLTDNATFTSLGGTFDVATTEMVMIKSAGSDGNGTVGGIHALAGGTAGAQYTAFTGYKSIATATTSAGNGTFVNNANSTLSDYNGTGATGATPAANLTFGQPNNAANAIFINSLRGSGGTPTAPAITSATTASATVGTAFSYTITASNNATSYAATDLPAGLTVNLTSGLISGTPTTAGNSSATISATNTGGTGNATLAFTIAQGTPVITTQPTASAITAGQALSSSTLTGGNASVAGTFAFATPAFVPSATGSHIVVFTPTDANYTTANTSVTVTVNPVVLSPLASWSGGNVSLTTDLLPLYAIGGGSYNGTVASETPVLSTTGGNLTLTAIVRTNDPALTITGETVSALSESWTTLGNGTASGDQTGVTTGLERRTFTTPADGTKKFLRLRAIYTQPN